MRIDLRCATRLCLCALLWACDEGGATRAPLDGSFGSALPADAGDATAATRDGGSPVAADAAPSPAVDAGPLPGSDGAAPSAPVVMDGSLPVASDGAAPLSDGGSLGASDAAADADPPRPPAQCSGAADAGAACSACTHQGLVEGQAQSATCAYLGIPYAKPPVGPLRFMAPEPADAWSGVRRATAFGAACVQSLDLSGTDTKSEDCLFINVWAPSTKPAAPLPVMVFIYGGGFSGGATNTYDGAALAAKGPVVVVSMNYRVGALGFFAHPELDRQRAGKPSGADGIRDQQLALRWVRDNVGSFHGDPGNVTVFGESAGSSSVCVHLVSPGSRNLARRFIMESGVCTGGPANGVEAMARDKAYAISAQMVNALCSGASDPIACLRGLTADQVILWMPSGETSMNLSWTPVIEGPGGVLPDHPDMLIQRGELHRGEIIIGTNKNEYGLFSPIPLLSAAELRNSVASQFGAGNVDAILALYPTAASDPYQTLVTLMTDTMFRCPSRRLARLTSAMGNSVYLYSFEEGGAWHAEELGYVFGAGYGLGLVTPVPALLDAVQKYWTSFALDGDPNAPGLVTWPKYSAAADGHMTLVNPPVAGSGHQRAACDYWDNYRRAP